MSHQIEKDDIEVIKEGTYKELLASSTEDRKKLYLQTLLNTTKHSDVRYLVEAKGRVTQVFSILEAAVEYYNLI